MSNWWHVNWWFGTAATSPSASSCVVTLYPSVDASAGDVRYIAEANQVADGVAIDMTPIVADVISDTIDYYRATLVQGVRYRIESLSGRFQFSEMTFEVPSAATADLDDLLDGIREV